MSPDNEMSHSLTCDPQVDRTVLQSVAREECHHMHCARKSFPVARKWLGAAAAAHRRHPGCSGCSVMIGRCEDSD